MKKGYILPSPNLRPYIDRYWYWESEEKENVDLPQVYPGSGTEFCLHYKDPFKYFPRTHIICPRDTNRYTLIQNGQVGFLSVRFKSSAFKYFIDLPLDLIKNKTLNAYDLWGQKGVDLERQILSVNDIKNRVDILNKYFESILYNGIQIKPSIEWAINHIYYNYKSISINNVITKSNLTFRTFQRRFKETVGVSAKEFHKISRFQTVLKILLLNKITPSLDFLLGSGYYDQSHFNKDFKAFTGSNPSSVLNTKNLAHFYNTSIK